MNSFPDTPSRRSASARTFFGFWAVVFTLVLVVVFAVFLVDTTHRFIGRSTGARATQTNPRRLTYSIGSPILGLKLSRLQMLSSRVGVGVAPIVTYSGGLIRGYLVRTNDAGATWRVSGVFPSGIYPWTTAFVSPEVGYVIDSTGALFTGNAGRTWSRVTTSGGPLSISVKGRVVWIPVEYCKHSAMQDPCSTHLDTYYVGALMPTSVVSVPQDQPFFSQVGSTAGYVFGSGGFSGKVYATTDSGRSWRSIANPCESGQITGGSAVSSTRLLLFCGQGPTVLYSSSDGGATWQRRPVTPGAGYSAVAGSSGEFLWQFNTGLWESSNGGRNWTPVAGVKYGPSGDIVIYDAHEAWHVVPGLGVFRTLNGTSWNLLK